MLYIEFLILETNDIIKNLLIFPRFHLGLFKFNPFGVGPFLGLSCFSLLPGGTWKQFRKIPKNQDNQKWTNPEGVEFE